MRNNQFKTKEEYLQYRKDWKAEYKQLSQTIREKKWIHAERNRMWNKAMIAHGYPSYSESKFWDYLKVLEGENPRYLELEKKYEKDRRWKELYSKEATAMLDELKLAKQEAHRQYLKQKNLVLA